MFSRSYWTSNMIDPPALIYQSLPMVRWAGAGFRFGKSVTAASPLGGGGGVRSICRPPTGSADRDPRSQTPLTI